MSNLMSVVLRTISRKTTSTSIISTSVTPWINDITWTQATTGPVQSRLAHMQFLSCRNFSALTCHYNSTIQPSAITQREVECHGGAFHSSIRLKSRGHNNPHLKQKKGTKEKASDSDSDDEDDEIGDDEDAVWDKHFDEDDNFPDKCKQIRKYTNSMRCDLIASAGLATSRKKVEEYLLSSQLYLNGQKIVKSSKKASEGDYIDVLNKENGETKVKRVRIVKVEQDSDADKAQIYLRCWRSFIPTDQYD